MVKLPVDDAEKFAMWMLQEFSYNKQTVMLAPGSGFYFNPDLGKQEVRIAYVLNIDDLGKRHGMPEERTCCLPGKGKL